MGWRGGGGRGEGRGGGWGGSCSPSLVRLVATIYNQTENESTITILLPSSEYCSDTCDRASGKFIFCSNMALCEIKTLSKVYAEAGVAG